MDDFVKAFVDGVPLQTMKYLNEIYKEVFTGMNVRIIILFPVSGNIKINIFFLVVHINKKNSNNDEKNKYP